MEHTLFNLKDLVRIKNPDGSVSQKLYQIRFHSVGSPFYGIETDTPGVGKIMTKRGNDLKLAQPFVENL